MPSSRYRIFEQSHPYFLTSTVVAWLGVFTHPPFVDIILDSWRFLQRERGIRIFGYVVLENHIHWIAQSKNLSKEVGDFKSYTAHRIIDLLEAQRVTMLLEQLRFHKLRHKANQEYQLWQESSHPQEIDGDEMMLQKLEYAHNNPVVRGYVDDPVHWRYSSARNYHGMPGMIDVTTHW